MHISVIFRGWPRFAVLPLATVLLCAFIVLLSIHIILCSYFSTPLVFVQRLFSKQSLILIEKAKSFVIISIIEQQKYGILLQLTCYGYKFFLYRAFLVVPSCTRHSSFTIFCKIRYAWDGLTCRSSTTSFRDTVPCTSTNFITNSW